MIEIEMRSITVRLGRFTLSDISLTVAQGQFFVLLGPTGAGKTVLLESIAGLRPIESGRILLGGRDITAARPEARQVGICYQDYALFPHMTAADNIRYGIAVRRDRSDPKHQRQFERLVDLLRIGHTLDRLPQTLSGGERQRVALARALMVQPEVLLLDEPLSALDRETAAAIQRELKSIHATIGTTTIMVTHQFGEAYALADRVGVINAGRLVQTGSLESVFEKPSSPFVARFAGMENILSVDPAAGGDLSGIWRAMGGPPAGGYIGIRPEHIFLGKCELAGHFTLYGEIRYVDKMPAYSELTIDSGGREWKAYLMTGSAGEQGTQPGESVAFSFAARNVALIPPAGDPQEV